MTSIFKKVATSGKRSLVFVALLTIATIAALCFVAISNFDECSGADIPGGYKLDQHRRQISLMFLNNARGQMTLQNSDDISEFRWEYDKSSENVFIQLDLEAAKKFNRAIGRDSEFSRQKSESALIGLSASCSFGQVRLYTDRDLSIYFSRLANA